MDGRVATNKDEVNVSELIDCQFETLHLRSMGGRFISYEEYMSIIRK